MQSGKPTREANVLQKVNTYRQYSHIFEGLLNKVVGRSTVQLFGLAGPSTPQQCPAPGTSIRSTSLWLIARLPCPLHTRNYRPGLFHLDLCSEPLWDMDTRDA
jgi:hypothetical protein